MHREVKGEAQGTGGAEVEEFTPVPLFQLKDNILVHTCRVYYIQIYAIKQLFSSSHLSATPLQQLQDGTMNFGGHPQQQERGTCILNTPSR